MKEKHNKIPDEVKHQIVQEYLGSNLTQREILDRYNIRGNNIDRWMRNFGLVPNDRQSIEVQCIMEKERAKTLQEQELEAKVRKLEKELEHERLRSLALDTMIDIAERELKISIRKKSGAKQSR